ncbi:MULTISPECIES: hydroxymethylglutaryl-CoA reductase, degradative [unclassified Flavobacterium]|uniref:hydroxymethylglutaryl-CoA reductase, degradative n=1 Tax=unclassified Flavobacterium TaxID=196869 RepID=UPI0012911E7E|nr:MULTISPECIES: hydroxymethylglutaryl-CoA reductase, degradative [unclassified Flavobacterium]MQP52647.1 hydroxymethylglutaryl-CoA reductase, degradative [Flavobacterium sp. LMO9]MQP62173.1 hydroxymethylglutaryl-CoA reductase, degradative [Flavobacterium sp. LMO6]
MNQNIKGFSKLSKEEKINWITSTYFSNPNEAKDSLTKYWNSDENLQKLHDEFIENTLTNFYLPYGVAPNFIINEKDYTLPMAIEESSVVAAASKAAKFWGERGGFKTTIINTEKIGQVHFIFQGTSEKLNSFFNQIKPQFFLDTAEITKNMQKRGGGILNIELRDKTAEVPNYYQLHATFNTKDSMGANFINTCLEQFAKTLESQANEFDGFLPEEKNVQIIMSILSNYVPNCLVRAEVSCPIEQLSESTTIDSTEFAQKFATAVKIAEIEPYRAVTHNKGIMNGIDAVVVATGNDFRAVEAGVHAYASRSGQYSSLSHVKIENGIFTFWMDVPLALGTVGGLTSLHPLVKFSMELLQNPSAEELMQIVAAAGLAQNFAALRSLTTTGIQQGHMKMHLMNILNQHQATKEEKQKVVAYFKDTTVTHSLVIDYLEKIRA